MNSISFNVLFDFTENCSDDHLIYIDRRLFKKLNQSCAYIKCEDEDTFFELA